MLAKQRAKVKKLEFSLVREDIVIPEICPALKIPLARGNRSVHDNSPTIDRIDPTKGYTKDNIVVISYAANRAKGNLTIKNLKDIVSFYERILSR